MGIIGRVAAVKGAIWIVVLIIPHLDRLFVLWLLFFESLVKSLKEALPIDDSARLRLVELPKYSRLKLERAPDDVQGYRWRQAFETLPPRACFRCLNLINFIDEQ